MLEAKHRRRDRARPGILRSWLANQLQVAVADVNRRQQLVVQSKNLTRELNDLRGSPQVATVRADSTALAPGIGRAIAVPFGIFSGTGIVHADRRPGHAARGRRRTVAIVVVAGFVLGLALVAWFLATEAKR